MLVIGCVPPARAVGEWVGRLRASRPKISFAWRRSTCASVHSAALRACCQALQTLMRPWVARPSLDRAIL
eukprot:6605536-Prymnesium_polylepis.1